MVHIHRETELDLLHILGNLEQRYGMTTEVFIERWNRGELDSHDFVTWAATADMAIRAGLLNLPEPFHA